MKNFLILTCLFISISSFAQDKNTIPVDPFTKILVGPHIELIIEEGTQEEVTVSNMHIDESALNIKVKGNTLMIYLDDARITTKHNKVYHDGYKSKEPVYRGTKVTANVSYKYLNKISLRGEEYHEIKNTIVADKFKVKMYGEGELLVRAIDVERFKAKMYGDNEISIREGRVYRQKYKSFGENKVDVRGIESQYAKSKNYGENKLKLNASEKIKFTALGESTVGYKGGAKIKKGIVIGENEIYRID